MNPPNSQNHYSYYQWVALHTHSWSKRAYKECPTIGFDTAETMVLQDYPLWQADIISDLSAHFLNTLCDIDRVRCKRLCIKFPSVWSDTAETIVLHHYPLSQENIISDLSTHILNTLFGMDRVR